MQKISITIAIGMVPVKQVMKPIIILILTSIIISGCTKNGDPAPQSKNNNETTSNNGSGGKTTGGTSQTPPDTTPKLTHDDSIHMATFNLPAQIVKTSISGTKLVLVYNENVNLLFSLEGYQKTSAVHLHEDFSKSLLAGFDYTTVAEGGNTTLDWVDDNLNNVIQKTVTDTLINNKNMVKINVHRAFTFVKDYSSAQAAQNEQAVFLSTRSDIVGFSSYCYYNQKNYLTVISLAPLVYSK
jgi:hypothetical protein